MAGAPLKFPSSPRRGARHRRTGWWALLLLLLFFPAPLFAHQTGKATFVAHVKPETRQVDTVLACPMLDVGHAASLDADRNEVEEAQKRWNELGFYLDRHIDVSNDGKPCNAIEHKLSQSSNPGDFWFLKAFECEHRLGKVVIKNDAMTETKGGYSHIGRMQLGEAVQTTVFTGQTPTFTLQVGEPPTFSETLWRFVREGIVHIAFGWDHVLFVFGLMLMSRRLRELLVVVTAFTLAHSVTLVLAALDIVTISPAIVEPVIALSIAWVAVEAVLDREERRSAYVATFLLGLVHGFGFSYVLRDEVGLAAEHLVPALLSFNVGVELGQLGIVLLIYPLRALLRDRAWERKAVVICAGLIGAMALYWFVERTLLA